MTGSPTKPPLVASGFVINWIVCALDTIEINNANKRDSKTRPEYRPTGNLQDNRRSLYFVFFINILSFDSICSTDAVSQDIAAFNLKNISDANPCRNRQQDINYRGDLRVPKAQ
jgi:hypothetical protein